MKLISALGPNPRMVRMYLLEKGLTITTEYIDSLAGDNRKEQFRKKNPLGQIPALELDDGYVLAETSAICEYLEELHPHPSLIGTTPLERAETRMWIRRVELNVTEHMNNAFRYHEGLAMFKDRIRCLPEAAEGLKAKGREGLILINSLLADRNYLCGSRITIADLALYCCLDFFSAASNGQPIDPSLINVGRWLDLMSSRPSASDSLLPGWEKLGLRG
ncbi:MAG: glutathione S-transferase family protein [Stenotrophobium sp.]